MSRAIHKRLWLAGVLLILGVNGLLLTGVAYNRSGMPSSRLTLTERELQLDNSYGSIREDSGMRFRVRWSVIHADSDSPSYGYYGAFAPYWLDKQKFAELGFDLNAVTASFEAHDGHYREGVSRAIYLALEYDGPAYTRALNNASEYLGEQQVLLAAHPDDKRYIRAVKTAKQRLEGIKSTNSRLYIVDAATSLQQLVQLYGKSDTYLFLRGEVRMYVSKDKTGEVKYSGLIREVENTSIHIPLEQRKLLAPLLNAGRQDTDRLLPRYTAQISWGRRLEPWIEQISPP